MHYDSIEDIRLEIESGEISLSPASITIGWQASKWGYTVWVYEEGYGIYEYRAGNSPWDSGQTVPLAEALNEETLRGYAQQTVREIAEKLGVSIEWVFEEESDD
jgi:hypothetical protein